MSSQLFFQDKSLFEMYDENMKSTGSNYTIAYGKQGTWNPRMAGSIPVESALKLLKTQTANTYGDD